MTIYLLRSAWNYLNFPCGNSQYKSILYIHFAKECMYETHYWHIEKNHCRINCGHVLKKDIDGIFFIPIWNVMREGIWAVWKYPLLYIMLQVIWDLGVPALLNWKNIWATKCCLYHQQAWENNPLWASMLQIRRCHLIADFYLQIENEKEKDRLHQWEKQR